MHHLLLNTSLKKGQDRSRPACTLGTLRGINLLICIHDEKDLYNFSRTTRSNGLTMSS